MASSAAPPQERERSKKGRVLSDQEAFGLLDANHNYLKAEGTRIGDKHQAEILADAMVREGLTKLAGAVTGLHNAMKGFARGDFGKGQHMEDPVIETVLEYSTGTKFADAAKELVAPLNAFREVAAEKVDWAKSANTLAEQKGGIFQRI